MSRSRSTRPTTGPSLAILGDEEPTRGREIAVEAPRAAQSVWMGILERSVRA